MRRLLTICVLTAAVTWSVPALAITAKSKAEAPKTTETKPAEQPTTTKSDDNSKSSEGSKSSLLNKLKRDVTESKSKPAKYDNFKDANKDGVSDNVQKQRGTTESESAAKAAPAPAPKTEEAKPTTTRTKDTSDKKKADPDR